MFLEQIVSNKQQDSMKADEIMRFQESDTIRTQEDIDAACTKELGENFTSINLLRTEFFFSSFFGT